MTELNVLQGSELTQSNKHVNKCVVFFFFKGLFSLWCERGVPSVRENYALVLDRLGKVRKLYPCLQFLNFLQLKIIFTSKWHMLG